MPKGFRKCKNCGVTFEKKRPLQSACSPICAFEWAKKLKEKKESKEWKERKREMQEELKTLSDYKKDLQIVFNKFIRLRDTGEPCISCGNPHPKKINAGHYKSVGSHPELRFEELNAHSQCEYCNTYLHGNLIEYRKNLINKIGLCKVEWLEENHDPKNYTKQEIQELINHYKQKIKEYESGTN